jgi:methylated-DNA-[protein]-cysteine S-methyltransferase
MNEGERGDGKGDAKAPGRQHFAVFEDRLGWALALAEGGSLVRLAHCDDEDAARDLRRRDHPTALHAPDEPVLAAVRRQLGEYLAGRRRGFDLPLAPVGTAFQRRVWRALLEIPYGETRSYLDLAGSVGNPKAVRAVGQANGRNPIGVVVPCHRVIAADGTLGGYAGGLDRKRLLLSLEGSWQPTLNLYV